MFIATLTNAKVIRYEMEKKNDTKSTYYLRLVVTIKQQDSFGRPSVRYVSLFATPKDSPKFMKVLKDSTVVNLQLAVIILNPNEIRDLTKITATRNGFKILSVEKVM